MCERAPPACLPACHTISPLAPPRPWPAQGELKFGPGEVVKEIEVHIIDDDMSEPDVTFSVVLSNLKGGGVVLVQVRFCMHASP